MSHDKLDMSLDEIISSSSNKFSGRRNQSSSINQRDKKYSNYESTTSSRRSPAAVATSKKRFHERNDSSFNTNNNNNNNNSSSSYSRQRSSNNSSTSNSIYVENLAATVVYEDLLEIFSEFDDDVQVQMHFDKDGTFLGSAIITFTSIAPARNAREKYYNVPLDKKIMHISHLQFDEIHEQQRHERINHRPSIHDRLGGNHHNHRRSGGDNNDHWNNNNYNSRGNQQQHYRQQNNRRPYNMKDKDDVDSHADDDDDKGNKSGGDWNEVMEYPCNAKILKLNSMDDETNCQGNSDWNTEMFLSPIDIAISETK